MEIVDVLGGGPGRRRIDRTAAAASVSHRWRHAAPSPARRRRPTPLCWKKKKNSVNTRYRLGADSCHGRTLLFFGNAAGLPATASARDSNWPMAFRTLPTLIFDRLDATLLPFIITREEFYPLLTGFFFNVSYEEPSLPSFTASFTGFFIIVILTKPAATYQFCAVLLCYK